MQKVLIIGSPGAGKSTFAIKLQKLLDLPLIYLDDIIWKPGRQSTPLDEIKQELGRITSTDQWIIEGNNSASLQRRAPYADTVIVFDYPPLLCIWRILKRTFSVNVLRHQRAGVKKNAKEKFDLSFLWFVWNFRRNIIPKVMEVLNESGVSDEQIYVVRNDRQAKMLIERIEMSKK